MSRRAAARGSWDHRKLVSRIQGLGAEPLTGGTLPEALSRILTTDIAPAILRDARAAAGVEHGSEAATMLGEAAALRAAARREQGTGMLAAAE